jgi:hypothetical protein
MEQLQIDGDVEWITNSFLVDPRIAKQPKFLKRLSNTARLKSTDTTPGGNIYHNPPPQYCRNADPKEPGVGGSRGMGRGYSEINDDTAALIHTRPGITAYNPMTRFFSSFYSTKIGYMNKTGEVETSLVYKGAKALGFITSIPLLPLTFFGQAVDYALNKPQTKYAYLKYTPALFFSSANNIFNMLTTYAGVQGPDSLSSTGDTVSIERMSVEERNKIGDILPDIWAHDEENGGRIDIFKVATRARRIAAARSEMMRTQLKNAKTSDEFYRAILGVNENGDPVEPNQLKGAYQNLPQMMKAYVDTQGKYAPKEKVKLPPKDGVQAEAMPMESKPAGYFDELQAGFLSGFKNGMDWISFRYEGEKSTSYSWSNEVGESTLASTLKGAASAANSASASVAGGNFGDASDGAMGLVGSLAEGAVKTAKDVVGGFLDGLGIGGVIGLGGAAYADLPEHWKDSSASMPEFNLTMNLKAWSGHPFCVTKRIFLPLSLALPYVLPRSGGHGSYMSPFHMEYFAKGHSQSRYAMCTSGSLQVGDEEGGWTVDGLPRSAQLTLTIKDLSTVMHMPVMAGLDVGDEISSLFADDNALSNFLASIGGLGYEAQNHNNKFEMLKLRKYLASNRVADYFNPTRIGMAFAETSPARLAGAVYNTWATGE